MLSPAQKPTQFDMGRHLTHRVGIGTSNTSSRHIPGGGDGGGRGRYLQMLLLLMVVMMILMRRRRNSKYLLLGLKRRPTTVPTILGSGAGDWGGHILTLHPLRLGRQEG